MNSLVKPGLNGFLKRKIPELVSLITRQANWRPGAATDVAGAPRKGNKAMFFEALEPRLLLNADVPGVDLLITQDGERDHDLLVRMVEDQQVAAADHAQLGQLEIIDLSNGNAVLASADMDTLNSVTLDLGAGDDRITIDTLSFGDSVLPSLSLAGSGGDDELVVTAATDTVWDITGQNSGRVSGAIDVSFSGIETLTGAADNKDTFILHENGQLSGQVDGGAAGFDVLQIRGDFSSIISTVSDASSGVIELDGALITYTGLEPIDIDGSVTALVLNTGDSDDEVLLEAGPTAGTFSLSSANGAFETHNFSNNVQSITLGLGSGNDSFTSTLTTDTAFQGNVVIDQTVDLSLGDVTGIDGNFTVNTVSGTHQATGEYLGWAGSADLDYDGSSVVIADGASIDITGDLSITVNANTVLNPASLQEFINAPIVRGTLDVGNNALINAGSVAMATIVSGDRQMHLGIDTQALLDIAIEDAKVGNAGAWGNLDFVDNNDGTGTITRTGGSWLDDGFAAGMDIAITGATNASNQTYQILDITATVATVALTGGATMPTATETATSATTATAYSFVRMRGNEQIHFAVDDAGTDEATDDAYLVVRTVPSTNADATLNGAPSLTFTHNDTDADTITRSSGVWADDGFAVGQTISVRDGDSATEGGVDENAINGNFTIAAINGSVLTLDSGDVVNDAVSVASVVVHGHMLGSFIDEGFAADDEFIIEGSDLNDGTYTVAEVYDRSLVLIESDRLLAESINLAQPDAPDLVLQRIKSDLTLAEVPLVLMGPDGQVLESENGELKFTQAELDAAYASNPGTGNEVLDFFENTPVVSDIFSAFTSFGVKVWVSDLTGDITLAQGSTITGAGDVSVTSEVSAEVEAATPSIMAGVSVVRSVVSSSVDMQTGARIIADGAVTVAADAGNLMGSSMSVTSGSIQNPAQGVSSGALGAATSDDLDPTGFSALVVPNVANSYLGPLGYIRVPGPAIAVAVGMADTDSAVTIADGASIKGASIEVASANQYSYSVDATSTIFQPGANMGVGAAIAASITDTDAITTVAGDLFTPDNSDADITISADSTVTYDEVDQADFSTERAYTGTNSVSASTWVREVAQGTGPRGIDGFSNAVGDLQSQLIDATALGDLTHENPGKFEFAAGVSFLLSDNDAEVIISSARDSQGDGGIVAGGTLDVSTTAVEQIFVGASGTAESGGEIAVAGGVTFARFDNTATTNILSGANLAAGAAMNLTANAEIPSNVSLGDTFYNNYQAAVDQLAIDKAKAEDPDGPDGPQEPNSEELKAELLAEAQVTFNESMAAAAAETAEFMFNFASTYRLGLGGAEGGLLSTYVNSAAGGKYDSADTHEEVVFKRDGTTPKFTSTGKDKTKKVSNETQEADYAVAGNVNILEIHNIGEVVIGEDVTAIANDILDVVSSADMDTVNMTGLASIRDILFSWKERATGGDDGGAIVSGGEGGIGASVSVRVFESVARNMVGARSQLASNSGAVNVAAATDQMHININEMGSDGGSLGIAGSVSVDVINTTTETLVDESALIIAATDVNLGAASEYLQVNAGISGTETTGGGGVAVGVAAGFTIQDSTTRAEVTDLDGQSSYDTAVESDAALANIQAGGDVIIDARRGEVAVAVALAGALQTGGESDSGSSGPTWDYEWGGVTSKLVDNTSATNKATAATSNSNESTVGAAGAANAIISNATVSARLGQGASVQAGGDTRVNADFSSDTIMIQGGGMLDLTSSESDLAIAGGVGVTVFGRDVDARVEGAVVHAGALDVAARQRDLLVVVSAGGAGAARSDAAVGVSAGINVFTNDARAWVHDSFVQTAEDTLVKAYSDTLLLNVSGAVGVVLDGDTGVGAAIGISHADGEVLAEITNSDVTAGSDVIVHAHHEYDLVTVVASAGVAGSGDAGAGQLSLQMVTGRVAAGINGDSRVTAGNNIAVLADGQIRMVNVTGGLALGTDKAIGVSLASSDIYEREVRATIGDMATVRADAAGAATQINDAWLGDEHNGAYYPWSLSVDGVLVKAAADDDIINIVVGVAVSTDDVAVQGSLLIDTNDTSVYAGIGSDAGTALNHATVTARNNGAIVVDSGYDFVGVNVVGGVAATFGKLGIGASLNVSVNSREVEAEIGKYAQLNADGSVLVNADLDATHVNIIFNAGLARGIAGAGAISVPVFNDFVFAQVLNNAAVVAGDDIVITSQHEFDFVTANVAIAAALDTFAAGISMAVVVQNDTVHATVGKDASLFADDSVLIAAASDARITNAAGGIAVGGKAGAGASAFLLVRNDDVRADVATGAALTGLAIGSGHVRKDLQGDQQVHNGVGVIAESREKIVGVAIQGAGGGNAGIAGAVPISVITETTLASVHDGAEINANNTGAHADQDVVVKATDDLVLVNVAGNIAIGGNAGVGVSADIASIIKTTSATLGDEPVPGVAYNSSRPGVTANAAGDVLVQTAASDEIVTIAVGVAGAGNAAIGLNGGVYVLTMDSNASIGRNAQVVAGGSVVVDANHETELDMIAASVAVAVNVQATVTVAVAGSFDLPIVSKDVTATVHEGAHVAAAATRDALNNIHSGVINASDSETDLSLANTNDGSISMPMDAVEGGLDLAVPVVEETQDGMYLAQDYSAATISGFSGVAVTATSIDDLQSITGGLAVAANPSPASVAVGLALDVDISTVNTLATVKDDAQVDSGNSVMIAAGSALDHLGVLVAAAGSTGGAAGLVGDIKVLETRTEAIVQDAKVAADGDISIAADAVEDLQTMALSVAVGAATFSPAVSVISLDTTTKAALLDGGVLDADGNILISAQDNTKLDVVDGGIGIGGAALSPGVGVVVITKDTTATIGNNTNVNARANGSNSLATFAGEQASTNNIETVQGLSLQAWSEEDIDIVVFGVAAGGLAVGGSAAVVELDSDTAAAINGSARINQGSQQGAAVQDVHVAAFNATDIDVVSGGMGLGVIGAGIGVGVVTLSNDTSAYLNGIVHAEDSVSVIALSDQQLHGVIFGGAGGAGALAGAVGVFDIGGNQSESDYSYTSGANDPNSNNPREGAPESGDAEAGREVSQESKETIGIGVDQLIATLAADPGDSGDANVDRTNTETTTITGAASAGVVGADASAAAITFDEDAIAGTSAVIGQNAVVTTTTGNIDVDARQDARFFAIVGGAAIGGVAASGGVGVATLDNDVTARISLGSTIAAGGHVSIDGVLVEDTGFTGFAGAGAVGVALSVTVVSLTDTSDVVAELGGTIQQAVDVSVTASSDLGLYAETVQASAALLGAAGGAATIITAESDRSEGQGGTIAGILQGSTIGAEVQVENVYVNAIGKLEIGDVDNGPGDNNAMATGGGAGTVSVTVGYAAGTDKRDTLAYIASNTEIDADSLVELNANSSSNVDVVTKGGAGGAIAAGLMFSHARIIESNTVASVSNASSRTRISATDVTVAANGDKLANAQTLAVAIGGFAISGTNATTDVTAGVEAAVGKNVEITATESVEIKAESDIEGDAFVESVSGGILSGGFSVGEVTVNPTTSTTISDTAELTALGDIKVYTKSGQAEIFFHTLIDKDRFEETDEIVVNRRDVNSGNLKFEIADYEKDADGNYVLDEFGFQKPIYALDDEGNLITRDIILNLRTGDVVQLHEDNAEGQYLDRDLSIIGIDRETIKIGSIIRGAHISADNDTIGFNAAHSYKDGDVVTLSEPEALTFEDGEVVELADLEALAFDPGSIIYQDNQGAGAILANSIFLANHGLQNGDQLVYNAGDLPVKGLVDGATYYVIVRPETDYQDYVQLSLAAPANQPASDDAAAWAQWNLAVDQQVVDLQRWDDALEIGTQSFTPLLDDGLTGTYKVTLIDAYTIKLQDINTTNSERIKIPVSAVAITDRNLEPGRLETDAFDHGDYITYYESGFVDSIKATQFDLVKVGENDDGEPQYDYSDSANTIYVANHDYKTGDFIAYYGGDDGTFGNLYIEQAHSFPINTATVVVVDENLIKLKRGNDILQLELPDHLSRNNDGAVVDAQGNPAGLADLGSLQTEEQVMFGLGVGRGYYVVDTDTNDGYIELARTKNGSTINFDTEPGLDYLTPSYTAGVFVREGVEMSRGWGEMELLTDLSSLHGADISLKGPGGIGLNDVISDVGDSISTVTVRNTSGGAVNVGVSEGNLDINVTLDTTIEGDLRANEDIRIDSENKTFGAVDNQLVGIGVLGGAKSTRSTLDYTENQTVTIAGDAKIEAGKIMVIKSETAPNMTTVANGRGGGLVDGNSSNARTTVNIEQNSVLISGDAVLVAAGKGVTDLQNNPLPGLTIQAITGGVASNSVTTSNGGFIAGNTANVDDSWRTNFTANTKVSIGERATVTANELLVEAINTGIDLDSKAHLSMGGVFGGGTARATVAANLNADVLLAGSATLNGRDGVRLNALNYGNSFDTDTTMYIIAIGGGQGWSEVRLTTDSKIITETGTAVYVGADASDNLALEVRAQDFGNSVTTTSFEAMIGEIHEIETRYVDGKPIHTSSVSWDGDVHISAQDSDFGLEISAEGVVTAANGVTVDDGMGVGHAGGDVIWVDDILGSRDIQFGEVVFSVLGGGANSVSGDKGTFFYNTGAGELEIINHSDSILYIQEIDTLGTPVLAGEFDSDVTISVDGTEGASSTRTLDFNIVFEDAGGDITIESGGAVVALGAIENRKGRTSITSHQSDIFIPAFTGGVVRSKDIILSAAQGNISANVDLVDDGTGNIFDIEAAGDLGLRLQALVIGGDADDSYIFRLPSVEVGGDIEIQLEAARAIQQPVLSGGAIQVLAFSDNGAPISAESGPYSGHYRSGAGSQPLSYVEGSLGSLYDFTRLVTNLQGANITLEGLGDSAHLISFYVDTDVVGNGEVNALANGDIRLRETSGDLRVGLIETTGTRAAQIDALDGSILDASGDAAADIVATGLLYLGSTGAIGSADNLLEIDSTQVTFYANEDVYLAETAGDLKIFESWTQNGSRYGLVHLESAASILEAEVDDALAETNVDIRAVSIELFAHNGRIGGAGDVLELDTLGGTFEAAASGDIYVHETDGEMRIVGAHSTSASVNIVARNPDLYLDPSITTQSSLTLLEGKEITAATSIALDFVHDFHAETGSRIDAGSTLVVQAVPDVVGEVQELKYVVLIESYDYRRDGVFYFNSEEGEARRAEFESTHTDIESTIRPYTIGTPGPGHQSTTIGNLYTVTGVLEVDALRDEGANMLFEGSVDTADGATINGSDDVDSIHFRGANLSGGVTAHGFESDDILRVTRLDTMDEVLESQVNGSITGRDVLNLVGGDGVDDVDVYTHGSADTSKEYVVNVDTDGVDTVDIWGTDTTDDIFLMRDTDGVAAYPGAFNMVSVLNGTAEQASTSGGPESVQRINVSTNQSTVGVHGGWGDNHFAVDSFVNTTLNLDAGQGNDIFIFGQYFGSLRDADAQVAALNRFDVTPVDDVYLSQSSSAEVNASGGGGNDAYVVNANAGYLHLDGSNISAVIPAFLMPGELNELPPLGDGTTADVVLRLNDSLSSDIDSQPLQVTAGSNDIVDVQFGSDYSEIRIAGLDDSTNISWTQQDGSLIGNDGTRDIIRLDVQAQLIEANSSADVIVTATLLGAMQHEDALNVDTLSITGVKLVSTDSMGATATSSVRVDVGDALPTLSLTGNSRTGRLGHTLTGSWAADAGADGSSGYQVLIDGVITELDQEVEIRRNGQLLATMTVFSDLRWELQVADSFDLGDPAAESIFLVDFGLSLRDGDQDRAAQFSQLKIDASELIYVPARGDDFSLTLTDNQSVDSDTVTASFTAGSEDLTDFTFGSDFNAIRVAGLDNAASLSWSLQSGELIASDTSGEVLRLVISAAPIIAEETGEVSVTAVLSGALAHENDINVDSLSISGIILIATDDVQETITQSITVSVADSLPTASLAGTAVNGTSGELLSGTWSSDLGADGAGSYGVMIDGNLYALDQAVELSRNGLTLGVVTIASDRSWTVEIADKLWNLGGDITYDISFGLIATDSDIDSALANGLVSIDVPAYVPATGQDAALVLTDTLTSDVSVDQPGFTAGSLDLVSFAFSGDFNTISVAGLDDQAALNWSLVNGALVGNDGQEDVIKLEISATTIAAGESGQIAITATLTGALAHEDRINVDSLSISGIALVATDEAGFELKTAVNLTVNDTLPTISSEVLDAEALHGETISGSWAVDAGADLAAEFSLRVDGTEYAFDQAIAVYGDGRVAGSLTVTSDGRWELVAEPDLWTVDGAAARYDFAVEIGVKDSDKDSAATQFDLAIEVPAVVFVEIGSGELVLDESLITDLQSLEIAIDTGTFALADLILSSDTSTIQVEGLDNLEALSWRLQDGVLIGADAEGDVLQLALSFTPIAAQSTGTATLTATLLGALAHEDDINVDSLRISGVGLVATDGWGYVVEQTVSVLVLDDLPEVVLGGSEGIGNYRGAQVHSGHWSVDMGADGSRVVAVVVNGLEYAVGETITVAYGEDYAGDLTVSSDGTWTFVGQKKTYDEGALELDISFGLKVVDGDGDSAFSEASFTLTRKLGKGNNGVGNGEDPPPPGLPPENDTNGATPGNPGNQGGADYDDGSLPGDKQSASQGNEADLVISTLDWSALESGTVIMATASAATPSTGPHISPVAETWYMDEQSAEMDALLDSQAAPAYVVANSEVSSMGEDWTVLS